KKLSKITQMNTSGIRNSGNVLVIPSRNSTSPSSSAQNTNHPPTPSTSPQRVILGAIKELNPETAQHDFLDQLHSLLRQTGTAASGSDSESTLGSDSEKEDVLLQLRNLFITVQPKPLAPALEGGAGAKVESSSPLLAPYLTNENEATSSQPQQTASPITDLQQLLNRPPTPYESKFFSKLSNLRDPITTLTNLSLGICPQSAFHLLVEALGGRKCTPHETKMRFLTIRSGLLATHHTLPCPALLRELTPLGAKALGYLLSFGIRLNTFGCIPFSYRHYEYTLSALFTHIHRYPQLHRGFSANTAILFLKEFVHILEAKADTNTGGQLINLIKNYQNFSRLLDFLEGALQSIPRQTPPPFTQIPEYACQPLAQLVFYCLRKAEWHNVGNGLFINTRPIQVALQHTEQLIQLDPSCPLSYSMEVWSSLLQTLSCSANRRAQVLDFGFDALVHRQNSHGPSRSLRAKDLAHEIKTSFSAKSWRAMTSKTLTPNSPEYRTIEGELSLRYPQHPPTQPPQP
ncbi:MAG: hypothetical protein KDJ36_18470, partial [Hyphomicrobiaceae bacterium]|nr:hypothetical protein [Hyphomicrobiaceae bacterium]